MWVDIDSAMLWGVNGEQIWECKFEDVCAFGEAGYGDVIVARQRKLIKMVEHITFKGKDKAQIRRDS
jgi:hypothetical protein